MRLWPLRTRAICYALLVLLPLFTAGCRPRLAYAPTREPVTLRFAYRPHIVSRQAQRTAQMQPLLDDFHAKYPWITVEAVEMQQWDVQLDLAVKDGSIDAFLAGREALAYAQQGLLKPLDDIQLGDWASIRSDYLEGTWEGLSIQGQQWGIPASLDIMVVYVNADRAKALEVSVPDSEWSLFDLMELVTKMNYPEGLPYDQSLRLFGFCTSPESIDPVIFVYLHGGRIVDDLNSPSQATLTDPLTVEAVEWYCALYTRHNVAPDPKVIESTFRQGGIYEAQMREACGTWLGWYSNRRGLDSRYEWSFDCKMLPPPRDKAELSVGEVEGYFITDGCTHPSEALKLLRFLSDRWEAAGQRLPPRQSLLEDDGYEQAVGKDVADIATAFSNKVIVMPSEHMPALERVGEELIEAIGRIIAEDLEPADVLAETQERVRTVFQSP